MSEHDVLMVEGRGYCRVCSPKPGWQRHQDDSVPARLARNPAYRTALAEADEAAKRPPKGFDIDEAFDTAAEDARLLAQWKVGPGARPTEADHQRLVEAKRDGRLNRRAAPPRSVD